MCNRIRGLKDWSEIPRSLTRPFINFEYNPNVAPTEQVPAFLAERGKPLATRMARFGRLIGILLNPRRARSETELHDLLQAAHTLGLQPHVLYAGTDEEFEAVFATLTQLGAGGLAISGDPFFNTRAELLGALSLKHAVPTMYQAREFAAAGGPISYGSSFAELYRLTGVYAGRVLKGEKPADLPVRQSTKLELIINLKTANSLGLDPPATVARPRRRRSSSKFGFILLHPLTTGSGTKRRKGPLLPRLWWLNISGHLTASLAHTVGILSGPTGRIARRWHASGLLKRTIATDLKNWTETAHAANITAH